MWFLGRSLAEGPLSLLRCAASVSAAAKPALNAIFTLPFFTQAKILFGFLLLKMGVKVGLPQKQNGVR